MKFTSSFIRSFLPPPLIDSSPFDLSDATEDYFQCFNEMYVPCSTVKKRKKDQLQRTHQKIMRRVSSGRTIFYQQETLVFQLSVAFLINPPELVRNFGEGSVLHIPFLLRFAIASRRRDIISLVSVETDSRGWKWNYLF